VSNEIQKPPLRKPPVIVQTITRRFREFFATQASSGILLIFATVLAMVAANSPLKEAYHHLLQTDLALTIGEYSLSKPVHFWINDGLMVLFFFVVGLEIKREALIGELASIKRAALPIAGALGGMIVPALIFTGFNFGTENIHGWGIPMATDIAFALGLLSLLGRRVPMSLKVFLTALAIVDDLGAVVVIAVFYTAEISLTALAIGGGALALAILFNIMKIRNPIPYAIAGVVLWLAFLESGVHPTIAGVLLGFTIPVRAIYDSRTWMSRVEASLQSYRNALIEQDLDHQGEIWKRQSAVQSIEDASERALSPLVRLEHGLQPWVAFGVMPIFALANAGVSISGESIANAAVSPVTWGIVAGLFFGKQFGVFGFSWLAVKLGLAAKPEGIKWSKFYGVALLAGIGFTMSLFITELAFRGNHEVQDIAKVAILFASLLAGVIGYIVVASSAKKQGSS
jgi:NhaA family Na+:H+ antiporter